MPYEIFKSGPRKGQPKTLKDRVIRYIEDGLGAKEIQTTSTNMKYRKFMRKDLDDLFLVGVNGAVRIGTNISNSIAMTDMYHKRMRLWEAIYRLT
jgi:hypothetical protein